MIVVDSKDKTNREGRDQSSSSSSSASIRHVGMKFDIASEDIGAEALLFSLTAGPIRQFEAIKATTGGRVE